MNISEGVATLKGRPAEIPDCGREELPDFFKEMGYKVGAEIGVQAGKYTHKLLRRGLKVYAIDPWINYDTYILKPGRMEDYYQNTQVRLAEFIQSGQCILVKKFSMDALVDIPDGSLDFVYIDGNHQLRYVVEDLVEWNEKVRSGGAISGHDFFIGTRPARHTDAIHVRYAVEAFAKAYHLENWFVLGERYPQPPHWRDRYRSFLWIKP